MITCDYCGQRLEGSPSDWQQFGTPAWVIQPSPGLRIIRGLVTSAGGHKLMDACGQCLVNLITHGSHTRPAAVARPVILDELLAQGDPLASISDDERQ